MWVENGGKIYFISSVHNKYVARLVFKHRILVFKLDCKLYLLQGHGTEWRTDGHSHIYHLYYCSYAMKPDGRRANLIIVEKSWPNRKETLIISVKLQPNAIHSQLGVISVRNRISRLKKLCRIKPIWRIRHFVDQQTNDAWRIRPRTPFKLYIVYMYSDAHM